MLKNANSILWITIVLGVVLASYATTQQQPIAQIAKERSETHPTLIPGAAEDEQQDFEDFMGPQGISTDQEYE